MKKIGIIGGGFSGTMTAVNLLRLAKEPVAITIITEKETFNKGIAFNPYSKAHLLNVAAAKMGAFADRPQHFLDWLTLHKKYSEDRTVLANAYLPRGIYGEYIADVWQQYSVDTQHKITLIDAHVTGIDSAENKVSVHVQDEPTLFFDSCIIASGNQVPRNPSIKNTAFFNTNYYFQNPWDKKAVSGLQSDKPVLIIGNGLTMIDTVIGLLEHDFKKEIYSISPNGFNILPHQHQDVKYTKLVEELQHQGSLLEFVRLFNKHIKLIRNLGLSVEPVIDSIRPHTQQIWQRMTDTEKQVFMSRLRHLWGVARHRVPMHVYDKIQHLRNNNRLHVYAGKILDITEKNGLVNVEFFNKKKGRTEQLNVVRVINCTGPETDYSNLEGSFLKGMLDKGIISQDQLKLGMNANPETFQVIGSNGAINKNIYTIGANLKGVLWESTAVNELRTQAEKLAQHILSPGL